MDSGPEILSTAPAPDAGRFADFAGDLTAADIPGDALRQAGSALMDTVGTAIGGSLTEAARIAAATGGCEGWAGPPPGPEAGAHVQAGAAFALAVAASALDFDDGHYLGGAIHPAAAIVPALLVAAPAEAGLDELIVAQVAGYEVGLRLAHLLWPRGEGARYHCTGTAACVGAAVAAAKLRGGDGELIRRAIEIAWCHAPMAALQFPMVKEGIGGAAPPAVSAVRLAEAGFKSSPTGARRPADPDVFAPTPFDEAGSEDEFTGTLGARFESAFTYLKPFSCCRYTHTAAAELRAMIAGGLDPAEVESVRVGTHRGAVFLGERRPPTLEHAQYSFPFVLGAIASEGDAGPAQIAAGRLGDEAILEFAARVTVEHDPAMDAHYPGHYAASLRVALAGGGTVAGERVIAPGDTEEPLGEERVRAKFERLAAPSFGTGAERLREILDDPAGHAAGTLRRHLWSGLG